MTDSQPPAPAPYGQNAQYAPYAPYGTTPTGAPLGPRTNTLAIVALVLGLTVPIGGIICGHMALNQIKQTGEAGRGLALAGTILGWVFTGFLVLYIVGVIAAVVLTGVLATSTTVY